MNRLMEALIVRARLEWDRNGIISTTTAIELRNMGVDVNVLEDQLAENDFQSNRQEIN